MIKKILKDVLGENFTENNEKYAKINFYYCYSYVFGFRNYVIFLTGEDKYFA